MNRGERRAREHTALLKQYTAVGFTPAQADLLTNKILDRRKPWRVEVLAVAALTLAVAALGWFKVLNVTEDIQSSREQIVIENCLDENARHDATISRLYQATRQRILDDPQLTEDIRQSREFTTLLINAIVPKRDCSERADAIAIDE